MENKLAKRICDKQYQVKFKASLPADADAVPDPAADDWTIAEIGDCFAAALKSQIDSNCKVNADAIYKEQMGERIDWQFDEEEKAAIMDAYKAHKKA